MKKITFLIVGVLLTVPLFAKENQFIRVGFGPGQGKYTFKDSRGTYPDGAFDQNLSGYDSVLSYVRKSSGNLIWGGGFGTLSLKGPSEGKTSGITKVEIEQYFIGFVFGLIGFEIAITNNFYLQPHVRFGLKYASAKFKDSTTDASSKTHTDTGGGFGIDLPIILKINNTVGLGANLSYSPNKLETKTSDSTQTHRFESSFHVNLLIDIHF